MKSESAQSFESVKMRLDEIVDAVAVDDISLDDALDLYEEAIKLGMKVSSLIEEDISTEQILGHRALSEFTSSQDTLSDMPTGEDDLGGVDGSNETGQSALDSETPNQGSSDQAGDLYE